MEKNLKKAVKEFNTVVVIADLDGNPTPVNFKSETAEKDLYDAITEHREPEDEFSEETEAVFAELKAKYDKPKGKSNKDKKADKKAKHVTVKAGTTVEMEADNDEIKIEKMKKDKKSKDKKGSEKEPEVGNVVIIKTILDRQVKKDELIELINTEEVFKPAKKALKKVTNFMSLKKQMLEVFPEEQVKALREEMPPIPRGEKKVKAEKVDDVLTTAIKDATKVKELKKIAKGSPDKFVWKDIKKLEDFGKMQRAMLYGKMEKDKVKVKAEPAKPKMVPNPLLEEIAAFENKKLKKLVKWAKEHTEFEGVKKLKKYQEFADMREALIAAIPAEIEVKSKGTSKPRGESHAAERKEVVTKLIDEGSHTRPEIMVILNDKFGEDTKSNHPNSNMLSEIQNPKYASKYGLKALVEKNKKDKLRWAK